MAFRLSTLFRTPSYLEIKKDKQSDLLMKKVTQAHDDEHSVT